ncbi:MAG: tripartite tricarboxylate transporter permease, partial [Candidatus Nanoarchaeia archaeon]
MFFEILISIFFGIIFGLVTGLVPGIHPNTVFIITIAFFLPFNGLSFYSLFAFIISVSISNTF